MQWSGGDDTAPGGCGADADGAHLPVEARPVARGPAAPARHVPHAAEAQGRHARERRH